MPDSVSDLPAEPGPRRSYLTPPALRDAMGDDTPDGVHRVEERVLVYLVLADGHWTIDPATLDGHELDGLERGTHHEGCGIDAPDEASSRAVCDAWTRENGDRLPPLPTGYDLAVMLAGAVAERAVEFEGGAR